MLATLFMNIVHFHRKPVSERYFSIENSFSSIRNELTKLGMEVNVFVCPHISQGFLPRLRNSISAFFYQKDINHITGDVHYLNFFFSKKKTVLTVHDLVFMKHPSALARKVLKLFWLTLPACKSAYITCISQSTKEELLTHIDFPEDRIKVIPTIVDEQIFSFVPKKFNAENPAFLFIGTTPNKNLERVAEALKGIPCSLEIVGPLSDAQKTILRENGIKYHQEVGISNAGIAEKYQETDVLIFPSTYEGFGMPILEAQLTGRPVITSDYSAMREVAGISTCLVNPFSIESIREGILKVISEEEYRKELIVKGTENVKRFSAHKVALMYLALYQEMYAKNKK